MLTMEEKELLNDIAKAIREEYDFSLIPNDKNFKRPEEIAEKMGGGILVDKNVFSVKVCRCGNGFLIVMPDAEDTTDELSKFAEGIATLIFGIKFNVSNSNFNSNPNMMIYNTNYREREYIYYLSEELICPQNKILENIIKCKEPCGTFHINDVCAIMGLRHDFLESRMVSCGFIKRW